MNYYIEIATINKAKQDIDTISKQLGYINLTKYNFGKSGVGRFLTKLVSVCRIVFVLRKDDTLFLQYPMKKFYKIACTLAHLRKAYVVTVIHDLGAFRRKKLTPEEENCRLSKTDALIVHNSVMKVYLRNHGFKGGLHNLQIFDYLSTEAPTQYETPHHPWRIVYAGNLGKWRNEFLYHLSSCMKTWEMDLYGNGFEDDGKVEKLHYHGFIPSDEFIAKAEADFGLVWDGDSIDECSGAWGEYLKINDPHKTSFYIRAGLPVIVWKKAAMADYILHENVGIAINSLNDIDQVLGNLSEEDYRQMKKNAVLMGKRLAEGYYIKEGLHAAHLTLKRKES